ncbi:MAG: OmpA family protein [Ignavibacteriae bacterium]|nr:OmpA family protein [Ignavibacteriota bacterium]
MRIFLPFLIFLVIYNLSSAQTDTLRTRYSLLGGYMMNYHTADFRALPDVPNCCPKFTDGEGNGIMAGVGIGFPIGYDLLFNMRMSYLNHNAVLQREEATNIINQGVSEGGSFLHEITPRISTVGIEPSISYRLFGELFLNIGGRAGVLLSPEFDQKEQIQNPSGATFADGSGGNTGLRIRNQVTNRTLPNAQLLQAALIGGISYELPLNNKRSFLVMPEVSYQYALTPLVQNLTWNVNALRMGISFVYQPQPTIEKERRYKKIYRRDTTERKMRIPAVRVMLVDTKQSSSMTEDDSTITTTTTIAEYYERQVPLPPSVLIPAISAFGVNKEGKESTIAELIIEEFRSEYYHPLLTYIFFDSTSASLPSRYKTLTEQQAVMFEMKALRGMKALDIYYDVLNIIGSRLVAYPKATITLTGCNSDNGVEKANKDLSSKRIDAIKSYLESVWNINAYRIKTVVRNLPEKSSNPLTSDGMQENRRVEIASSIPEITDVVNTNDTLRITNPPLIRFKPSIVSSEGIVSWKVTVSQNGIVLMQYNGTSNPPTTIDWDIAKSQATIPRYDYPITVTIEAKDIEGNTANQTITLPTNQRTLAKKKNDKSGDKLIENYGLILFDFGKSTLSERNLRVTNFVKGRLKPNSTVTLAGYTDRTGNLQINQRLSGKRAESAAKSIGRPDAQQKGIGQTELLYDNTTPEGRQYCRTVQIMVETNTP